MVTWRDFKNRLLWESKILDWLVHARWFRGKAKKVQSVQILDGGIVQDWALCLINVCFTESREIYFVPLRIVRQSSVNHAEVLAKLSIDDNHYIVQDAFQFKAFKAWLIEAFKSSKTYSLEKGQLVFKNDALQDDGAIISEEHITNLSGEQSNTSFIYQSNQIIKVYRQLEAELNPELEMLLSLGEKNFSAIPKLLAHAIYESSEGGQSSVAIMQPFIKNQGDGWSYVLTTLKTILGSLGSISDQSKELKDKLSTTLDNHFNRLNLLGKLTGQMHYLLGLGDHDQAISPVPCQVNQLDKIKSQFENQVNQLTTLISDLNNINAELMEQLKQLVNKTEELYKTSDCLTLLQKNNCDLTRYHGDYHLGQVLVCDQDWMIIDFEGEPLRSIAERRAHTCPLKDVAGMLRSFNYAAQVFATDNPNFQKVAEVWETMARQTYLDGYWAETIDKQVKFLPTNKHAVMDLIRFFELEKALYEIYYEINNRPEWIHVPLNGILRLL